MKTKPQKATYNPTRPTKYTRTHRRESGGFLEELAIISLADKGYNGRTFAPITARIYCNSTKSANTACLWINAESSAMRIHTQGSGIAKGWGYHRPSEALGNAIRNAGFDLSQSIAGVGEQAMEDALMAIAKTLGIKHPVIHRAHA